MSKVRTQFTMYLIAYDPPDMPMEQRTHADIERMMSEADCCFTRGKGEGIEIGEVVPVTKIFDRGHGRLDNQSMPEIGDRLRCVGHRYFGKLVDVELVEES